jgi:hypothetical protein
MYSECILFSCQEASTRSSCATFILCLLELEAGIQHNNRTTAKPMHTLIPKKLYQKVMWLSCCLSTTGTVSGCASRGVAVAGGGQ